MGIMSQYKVKSVGDDEMAGIKDVAKLAGVGVGTVSRALNKTGYVSEETKEKIDRAMAELQYKPNELARNLYHKKTGIIAVLVPDIAYSFFSDLVRAIESDLYEYGFKTMVCSTFKTQNYEREYIDMLDRHMVDGIITGVHSLDIEDYLKTDKPVVSFDRYLGKNIPVVGVNHWKGGTMAAERLIEAGCTHVVQFQGSKAVNSPSHDRHTAFVRRMEDAKIPVVTYELDWNRFDVDYFKQVAEEVFLGNPEIDGAFGADLMAIAYMKAALTRGKRIPEDLKIVAYDGTLLTTNIYPEVTAIVQPIEILSKKCTELIVKKIEGDSNVKEGLKDIRIMVDVFLREGGTT